MGYSGHSSLTDFSLFWVQDAQSTVMCAVAAAMIVLYDAIISIDREVELIWKKRWSLIKVVYLWHRYFGIACIFFQVGVSLNRDMSDALLVPLMSVTWSLLTQKTTLGSFWFHWEAWAYTALSFASEAVLVLWIWVAYNRSKVILTVLIISFTMEIAAVVTIIAASISDLQVHVATLPRFTVCGATHVSGSGATFRLLWVPILACHSLLLGMFAYKGLRIYCSRTQRERFGVMYMVYKHTLPNFLAIVASYLVCAVMWLSARPSLGQIPVSFTLAFSITNCTRLLINIRRAYYNSNEGTTAGLTPQSSIAVTSRLHAAPSFARRGRHDDSFDLEFNQHGEIAVEVRVEVTRTFDDGDADDLQYEMKDMSPAVVVV